MEIYDTDKMRLFLRKTFVGGLEMKMFYPGAKVTIMSRLMNITGYADPDTKAALKVDSARGIAILPLDLQAVANCLNTARGHGFRLNQLKLAVLPAHVASSVGVPADSKGTVAIEFMYTDGDACTRLQHALADVSDCLTATTPDVVDEWGAIFFPDAGSSSGTPMAMAAAKAGFLPSPASCTQDVTLAVVKPHAVEEGLLGPILTAISEGGFTVTGMEMRVLTETDAADFYEVYRGVVPQAEFHAMMQCLSAGACVALEIQGAVAGDGGAYGAFREMVGPRDPEVARLLRPESLRARFGTDKVRNALHCTDLEEDTAIESEYFFRVLNARG